MSNMSENYNRTLSMLLYIIRGPVDNYSSGENDFAGDTVSADSLDGKTDS